MDFESEIRERMTAVEQSVKSAHHRLDTQDKLIGSVQKLTQQVIQLASDVKNIAEDVAALAVRVGTLENEPKEKYSVIIKAIITTCVSGVAGFVIAQFFK